MPRRAVLTDEQREAMLALPEEDELLVRYWTLSDDDIRLIARRRRPHNRLGFALQLCALRYPGRLLKPGEVIASRPLTFVATQLDTTPDALLAYAARSPTRYEQLDTLRGLFGFVPLSQPARLELRRWLVPIALTTTNGAEVVRLLLGEFRSRKIIVPGITLIERMAAEGMLAADRHVAALLTQPLTVEQKNALDRLLLVERRPLSPLAQMRQPPGRAGRRAFATILERRGLLRAIGIDPAASKGVHPERLRRLSLEGARLTAQHLRVLAPARRHAVLVATVLEAQVTLTDDAVLMFERLFGQMYRRVERREEAAIKRDRTVINGKIRLFARLGQALIEAHKANGDALAAVERVIGWDELIGEVVQAQQLVRPDPLDPIELAQTNFPILRQIGPAFVQAFEFGAVPACASLAAAIEVMRALGSGRLRKVPADAPLAFIRPTWRRRIGRDRMDRRVYEFCVLAELRDRLRAGDMWVEGSRRYRAVEQQLIPAPVFAQMRVAGPLPVPAPDTPNAWLTEKREQLTARLRDIRAKIEDDALEDVELRAGRLKISPLTALVPDDAERALAPLYASMPTIRITDLLADVDRWTGITGCFTHVSTGRQHDDARSVLTAILADATNLGHSRMAEACSLVTQRQLSWLASWICARTPTVPP